MNKAIVIIASDVTIVQNVQCLLLNCLPSLSTCFVIFECMRPSQILLNLSYNESEITQVIEVQDHMEKMLSTQKL